MLSPTRRLRFTTQTEVHVSYWNWPVATGAAPEGDTLTRGLLPISIGKSFVNSFHLMKACRTHSCHLCSSEGRRYEDSAEAPAHCCSRAPTEGWWWRGVCCQQVAFLLKYTHTRTKYTLLMFWDLTGCRWFCLMYPQELERVPFGIL